MAVPVMHEDMHPRTGKDEKEWKPSQQVRFMFGQKEEATDESHDNQADSTG